MPNEELILKKLEEVTVELKETREDRTQIKVSQAHHEGNLKVLAAKFDDYIADARERKADTNERWKIVEVGPAAASKTRIAHIKRLRKLDRRAKEQ